MGRVLIALSGIPERKGAGETIPLATDGERLVELRRTRRRSIGGSRPRQRASEVRLLPGGGLGPAVLSASAAEVQAETK
jgi:hypothetical protein